MRSTFALAFGAVAAAAAPVAPAAAIAGGAVALAFGVWTLARKPASSLDFGFASGGVVLGLVGLGLGAAVQVSDDEPSATKLSYVDGIATATPDSRHPPQKDLAQPLPCRVEIDALRAAVTVTNSLDQPADYTIIVVWEENDLELARNTVVISSVPPSLSRQREAFAAGTGSSQTTCRAIRVDRVLSAGG